MKKTLISVVALCKTKINLDLWAAPWTVLSARAFGLAHTFVILLIGLLVSNSYAEDGRFESSISKVSTSWPSVSKVAILIEVPKDTPRDAEIYITGSIDGWSGGTVKRDEYRARYLSPGKYTIELSGKPNEKIDFKFTQGSWARGEMTIDGEQSPARSYVFKNNDEQVVETVEAWSAYLNKAIIHSAPQDRKDGLVVGELGTGIGKEQEITQLAEEIAAGKHDDIDSLLIAHKGKFVFESYYRAGNIDLRHFQASATKAYTGLALGRAIQLGYLTMADLDRPLVSFLKDLDKSKLVEGAETITLNHALTMRSGIRITQEQESEIYKNPSLLKGQGKVQALLEKSAPITAESQSFKYGGGAELIMQVIEAVVLEEVVPKDSVSEVAVLKDSVLEDSELSSAKDFIKKELLDKLGITNYRWNTNEVTGLPEAGWKTQMTSRDMLKWGTLAANKGVWNGEPLIPKAFIDKAVSRILHVGDDDIFGGGKDVSNQGYGYFWWNADLKYGDNRYFVASAQGGGGQFIILIKQLDLVIVVTAHDNDNQILQLTAERIIPAFL